MKSKEQRDFEETCGRALNEVYANEMKARREAKQAAADAPPEWLILLCFAIGGALMIYGCS